jgi:hypothetical protein
VPFIGVLYPVSRGRISPESYRPTVVEWGVSIGLIAATIFLFGLGARLMPVLPKEEVAAPSKGEGGLRIEYCDDVWPISKPMTARAAKRCCWRTGPHCI